MVQSVVQAVVPPRWFRHSGSVNGSGIVVPPQWFHHSGCHGGSVTLVESQWFSHSGSGIVVLSQWFCHNGSVTVVQSVVASQWFRHSGSVSGSVTVVLSQWFRHSGSVTVVPSQWFRVSESVLVVQFQSQRLKHRVRSHWPTHEDSATVDQPRQFTHRSSVRGVIHKGSSTVWHTHTNTLTQMNKQINEQTPKENENKNNLLPPRHTADHTIILQTTPSYCRPHHLTADHTIVLQTTPSYCRPHYRTRTERKAVSATSVCRFRGRNFR